MSPLETLLQALSALASDPQRERIFVGDILGATQGQAIAAMMLLFALPNALPMPPGTSAILGTPLLLLSLQLMLGIKPWLPRAIAARSLPKQSLLDMLARAAPWSHRAQVLLKPRWRPLTGTVAMRGIGAVCSVLATIVVLPIPLGNMLPALAISVIALGMLQRDGVWVLAGTAIGAASVALVAGVAYALVKAGASLLLQLAG